MARSPNRWPDLERDEWRVLAGAVMLTPIVAMATRALSVNRAFRFISAFPLPLHHSSTVTPERTAILVGAATARLGAACLTTALILQKMLGCAGVDSELVIGAAKDAHGFRAHAWVRRGSEILIGDGQLDGYAPLCVFPPNPQRSDA